MLLATSQNLQAAADHLAEHDAVLRPIIERARLATLQPHTNYYGALVSSIVSQQLSVKAADAIEKRFLALFDGQFPTPEQILSVSVEKLRAIGFSNAKGRYVHDLAQHIIDGKVTFDRIPEQSNEEIIAELTDVKGIGEWTVHMFLMFCVGRLDVLPVGDLGVKNGIRALYGLEDAPTPQQITEIAETYNWHPYESVASWYVWHSLDNKPAL
ncbi:MAG TPA: DNA-3-methyladenine glycosylase [Candidatus Saccharimonadales bacterium]